MGKIGVYRVETRHLPVDDSQSEVVDAVEYILLVLHYCNRFYYRQKEMTAPGSDILSRFQQVLTDVAKLFW